MAVDPPPDLVAEVAVGHPSVSKFPICAELGIPEIRLSERYMIGPRRATNRGRSFPNRTGTSGWATTENENQTIT